MPSFKFGQIEVASEDFQKERQITDIFTIDEHKAVLSNKCHAIMERTGDTIIQLFIKTPKTYLAMACHNMKRTLLIQCHLMFLRSQSGCFNIETFGMRLSRSYLKSCQETLQKEKVSR